MTTPSPIDKRNDALSSMFETAVKPPSTADVKTGTTGSMIGMDIDYILSTLRLLNRSHLTYMVLFMIDHTIYYYDKRVPIRARTTPRRKVPIRAYYNNIYAMCKQQLL